MKAVFVFALVCLLGLSFAEDCTPDFETNGMPECTNKNVATKDWRNNWDPTRYWQCSTAGQSAVSIRCPDEHLFLDSVKKCVPWQDWEWTQPCVPPTA